MVFKIKRRNQNENFKKADYQKIKKLKLIVVQPKEIKNE